MPRLGVRAARAQGSLVIDSAENGRAPPPTIVSVTGLCGGMLYRT